MAVLIASGFQSLRAEIVHDVILSEGYLEIEYSAGAGQNVSYHVVDFASTGGESFAFAYHFDGPTESAHAALLAIDGEQGGVGRFGGAIKVIGKGKAFTTGRSKIDHVIAHVLSGSGAIFNLQIAFGQNHIVNNFRPKRLKTRSDQHGHASNRDRPTFTLTHVSH